MTKSSIINAYLEAMEENGSIEDEETLLHQRKIVRSVINRLVKQELALMEMTDRTRLEEGGEEQQEEDPVMVINPSYYDEFAN